MPKSCGCTELIYCDAHARRYSAFRNSLGEAFASAMMLLPGTGHLLVFKGSSVWEIKSDALAFSDADAAYLKKLRISPE